MNNGYEHASQYQLFLCAYPHGKRVMPLACERVITCRVRAFTLFPEIPWIGVDCPTVSSEGTLTLRDDIMQEVVCDTGSVWYAPRSFLEYSTARCFCDCHRMFCHLCSCTGWSCWRPWSPEALSPCRKTAASTQWAWLRWPLLPP